MKIRKVYFINPGGGEYFDHAYVPGDTPYEVIKSALQYYKMNNFTWSFDGIEIDKDYVREVEQNEA